MNTPYIFGYLDGEIPEIREQKKEARAYEQFMLDICWDNVYEKRCLLREMEAAVKICVWDILSRR